MELQALKTLLQNSGVVGAGGAGFPTYAKLDPRADTVLLNCAECEPLLTLHRQLLARRAPEILSAFAAVAETLGAKQAIVCVKAEYQATVEAVRQVLPAYPAMRLAELASVYPTGDEVVLIYEATGRVVRPGGLPIEQGVVVFNVETMFNIHRALESGAPVVDKLVTVAGAVKSPVTVRVPIGTPIGELLAMAGGAAIANPALLVGGPMMGNLGSEAQPVTKTTNAVLVLPPDHSLVLARTASASISLKRAASVCCQCQSCTDLCPRNALGHPIQPHLFMRAAANNDFRDANVFLDTMFCCGCGICELYACPQSLAPRTLITIYKNGLRQAGIKPPQDAAFGPVKEERPFRRVPEPRLAARTGLAPYEHPAPLDAALRPVKRVTVRFSQHIGSPAQPVVAVGEDVARGQVIGAPGKGLSVAIHAPICGRVVACNPQFAILERKEE